MTLTCRYTPQTHTHILQKTILTDSSPRLTHKGGLTDAATPELTLHEAAETWRCPYLGHESPPLKSQALTPGWRWMAAHRPLSLMTEINLQPTSRFRSRVKSLHIRWLRCNIFTCSTWRSENLHVSHWFLTTDKWSFTNAFNFQILCLHFTQLKWRLLISIDTCHTGR